MSFFELHEYYRRTTRSARHWTGVEGEYRFDENVIECAGGLGELKGVDLNERCLVNRFKML